MPYKVVIYSTSKKTKPKESKFEIISLVKSFKPQLQMTPWDYWW